MSRRRVQNEAREAETLPPLWEARPDGSRYPNREAEEAILAMRTPKGDTEADTMTLGDLILDALIPGWLSHRSFEQEFLIATARELRAVLVAAHEGMTGGDMVASFSRHDADHALHCITRRMEAGAELLYRIKAARGLKIPEVAE